MLSGLALRGLGKVDRFSWANSFPTRLLYSPFTWVVPAHFLDSLQEIEWAGGRLRIPGDAKGYLEYRYGEDWQTKKSSWIYFLDDRSIFVEAPETLVPRLERARWREQAGSAIGE